MYPALPFGPITLPTGPIFALLAIYFGLDTAARFGRRLGLRADDVWNAGLVALFAGLIVARLWNVIQFWYIYAPEPALIFSPRPSGFALGPGLIGAVAAAYAYLLWRALDPVRMVAAFAVGWLMAAAILAVSAFLTGTLTGLPSDQPWGLPYFGERQHPVGLYQAMGFALALGLVWGVSDPARPGRSALLAGLGYGLVLLVTNGFAANDALIGAFRAGQLWGFVLALGCAAGLAVEERRVMKAAATAPADHS